MQHQCTLETLHHALDNAATLLICDCTNTKAPQWLQLAAGTATESNYHLCEGTSSIDIQVCVAQHRCQRSNNNGGECAKDQDRGPLDLQTRQPTTNQNISVQPILLQDVTQQVGSSTSCTALKMITLQTACKTTITSQVHRINRRSCI